jgi:hypothetical protein
VVGDQWLVTSDGWSVAGWCSWAGAGGLLAEIVTVSGRMVKVRGRCVPVVPILQILRRGSNSGSTTSPGRAYASCADFADSAAYAIYE